LFTAGAYEEEMSKRYALFWKSEGGQDLVEYALLLGFVCLAGVAAFLTMGGTTSALWNVVNSRLAVNNVS
jgi:Flp pilus assembly pilin Flp